MDFLYTKFIFLVCSYLFSIGHAGTYSVKIITDTFINEVDSKFLSFQIDPKFLFSKQYQSKESICMSAALSPAYLQIAGPSTSQMTFDNYTITLQETSKNKETSDGIKPPLEAPGLVVTPQQWSSFVHWAKKTGFELVFALNNEEKTDNGLWDPNSSLSILTVAEVANMSHVYWQLGYKCKNQSIEEYLNDLETLRVITETFPVEGWKVIGGDVTSCLRGSTDFRDYVTLAVDMMDAVILNGTSTARELSLLSTSDRYKLIHLLTKSSTPLWLTDSSLQQSHLERAADWIISLGYAARNGFSVHFRELVEEEVYKPTLSFYMALLYKNLVGDRVLSLGDDEQAYLFAHCTSLRQKPVPGALTLYAVNMDDEPARFSIKLTEKEDGGDIMQFILGKDSKGNIIVNGKAMQHEGDIRAVVKRVRPYKTLLLKLPSKTFGFWVLANTKIQACQDIGDGSKKGNETKGISDDIVTEVPEHNKVKRSIGYEDIDSSIVALNENSHEDNRYQMLHPALQDRINYINNDLKNIRKVFEKNIKGSARDKRQFFELEENKAKESNRNKQRKHHLKSLLERVRQNNGDNRPKFDLIRRILELHPKLNLTRSEKSNNPPNEKRKRVGRIGRNKINKRNSNYIEMSCETEMTKNYNDLESKFQRHKRSILSENNAKTSENTKKSINRNEIDVDNKETFKLKKILHNVHDAIYNLPINADKTKRRDVLKDYDDKSYEINSLEDFDFEPFKSNPGLINSSVKNLVKVLNDMNENIKRFWNSLNIFE